MVGNLLENGNYNWGFNAATGDIQGFGENRRVSTPPRSVPPRCRLRPRPLRRSSRKWKPGWSDKPKKTEANMLATILPMDFRPAVLAAGRSIMCDHGDH